MEPRVPLSQPTALCHHAHRDASCRAADEVEAWLRQPGLRIVDAVDAPAGKQGAKVLTLATRDTAIVFRAKWRANESANPLNVPRRELAAHAVQKLFLAPDEWVVPPTAGHCFALGHYRALVDVKAKPLDGTACVHGFLSYWLEGALGIDDAHSAGWIEDDDPTALRDGARGAHSVANVNLLAHLIDHGDSHPAQFVVTVGPFAPRFHLVDNTLAFSPFRNPTLDPEWDWSRLHVKAIPRESAQRLAALAEHHILSLLVMEQYERRDGLLLHEPPGPTGQRTDLGYRWSGGDLQVGLTYAEAARLHDRVRGVVQRLAQGTLRTF